MTFGMAAVLLILIIAGIILAVRGLQQRKILCIIIIVLLSVFGLALAVYMGDGQIVNAINSRKGIGILPATYKGILTVRRLL